MRVTVLRAVVICVAWVAAVIHVAVAVVHRRPVIRNRRPVMSAVRTCRIRRSVSTVFVRESLVDLRPSLVYRSARGASGDDSMSRKSAWPLGRGNRWPAPIH
jgi:hypothetical protein